MRATHGGMGSRPRAATARTALRPPAARFRSSFVFAARGLGRVWRAERNFRVQVAAAWAILCAAALLHLAATRVALLILAVVAVLAAEAMNSALEVTVDLISPGRHPLAAAAKDLAAAAVLTLALGALAAGLAIFWQDVGHPVQALALLAAQPLGSVTAVAGFVVLVFLACRPLAGRRVG